MDFQNSLSLDMRTSPFRLLSHLLLGIIAFACLTLAVLPKSFFSTEPKEANFITIPPIDPSHKAKIITEETAQTEVEPSIKGNLSNQGKTIEVQAGDTLAKIFSRLGISASELEALLSAGPDCKKLQALQPGQTLSILQDKEGKLQGLTLAIMPANTLEIIRRGDSFKATYVQPQIEKQLAYSGGAIQNSLFSAGKRAGLDYALIKQMVDILGWDIDFALDIQPNDTFHVLFEEKYSGGEKIGTGNILAVEFVNRGKTYRAVRYTDKNGKSNYFSPDGYGMHKTFLRTPVKFSHISSRFGLRKHPIHHRIKAHQGIDYAAATGTPVKATADGVVSFAGVKGGYGKAIELRHAQKYTTFYAHLSKFAKNVRHGTKVSQGDVIGYVGQTGLATGPHLHYEFRIAGVHRDPLTVTLPKMPIPNITRKEFLVEAKKVMHLMERYKHVSFAKNQSLSYE